MSQAERYILRFLMRYRPTMFLDVTILELGTLVFAFAQDIVDKSQAENHLMR